MQQRQRAATGALGLLHRLAQALLQALACGGSSSSSGISSSRRHRACTRRAANAGSGSCGTTPKSGSAHVACSYHGAAVVGAAATVPALRCHGA